MRFYIIGLRGGIWRVQHRLFDGVATFLISETGYALFETELGNRLYL